MSNADRPASQLGQSLHLQSRTSLLIVGGGIMGLWAALKADRLGIDTLLVEGDEIGSGASGGLLGALMPYMPDNWDQKKQFQFDSLLDLEVEINQLEAQTGLSAGFRRSGRFIPLPKPHLRTIAERHQRDALANWKVGEQQFYWRVEDHDPALHHVSAELCESGLVMDTLAARVAPRAYVQVLRRALEQASNVRIVEKTRVETVDNARGCAQLSSGEVVSFGHVIVAGGYQAFPLIGQALGRASSDVLGAPIKGQSALLKADIDPASPVVFLNGIYIIPHEDGTVAVGSTSENQFEQPFTLDEKLEQLLEKARDLMPQLKSAEVIERWAGLRPRAVGREPMIGSIEAVPNVVALAGGFKISFGLAHSLAEQALKCVLGQEPEIPANFHLRKHLSFLQHDDEQQSVQ
jgi:glycine oxidase